MPDRFVLPLFVVLWSSGYVVGALAIDVADPVPLLALRFTLAALVAVPLALRHGRWRGAPLGRLAMVGVLLQVVQFGGVYGGFALGVPAALSALASPSMPTSVTATPTPTRALPSSGATLMATPRTPTASPAHRRMST